MTLNMAHTGKSTQKVDWQYGQELGAGLLCVYCRGADENIVKLNCCEGYKFIKKKKNNESQAHKGLKCVVR